MVDRIKRNVDGGIAADGDVGPEQVVVDGRWDADHVNPELAEQVRARLRAVAANRHHTIDALLREVAKRLGPAALVAEFGRTRGAQKRAADLNDAADVARTELSELTVDQAFPALAHSVDRHV